MTKISIKFKNRERVSYRELLLLPVNTLVTSDSPVYTDDEEVIRLAKGEKGLLVEESDDAATVGSFAVAEEEENEEDKEATQEATSTSNDSTVNHENA